MISFVSFSYSKIIMEGSISMKILVEEFQINLMEDGKNDNTVQSYVGDITAFLKYLAKMGVEFDGVLKGSTSPAIKTI